MPRRCTVCDHPARAEIDAEIVAGGAYRGIAKRFGASPSAMERHKAHVPAALALARDAADAAHGDDLLAQVRSLNDKALSILRQAEADGDLRVALQAVRESRGTVELLARLLGELQDGATVNVLVSAEWTTVRTVVLQALAPYPEARLAVSQALIGSAHAGV